MLLLGSRIAPLLCVRPIFRLMVATSSVCTATASEKKCLKFCVMNSLLGPLVWEALLVASLATACGVTLMFLSFSSHQCQLKEPSQPLPLPSEGSVEDEELPAQRYERDLVQKLKVLRHELSLQQPQAGHCRIEVSREEIFEVCN